MLTQIEKHFSIIQKNNGEYSYKSLPNSLSITWVVHNKCNYTCSYCPAFAHDGSHIKYLNIERAKPFFSKVFKHYNSDLYDIWMTGGEPTVTNGLIDFVKWARDNGNMHIGMTSNASRTMRWWEDNWKHFDHLALSYHSETADPDDFVQKYLYLTERIPVATSIMMHPNNWDKCTKVINEIKAKAPTYKIEITTIFDDWPRNPVVSQMYSNEQREWLKEQAEAQTKFADNCLDRQIYAEHIYGKHEDGTWTDTVDINALIARGENNFKGWLCWIGLKSLAIDEKGDVYNALCHFKKKLGNIYDDSVQFPTIPVVCGVTNCHCHSYAAINKRKI